MKNKAQAQVITIILIILLALAAIVIVWQVISSTVETSAKQIEDQSSCIGVSLDITSTDTSNFNVVRKGGGSFASADVAVLVDGVRLAEGPAIDEYQVTLSSFTEPLGSAAISLGTDATASVEVALIGDGVTCPTTDTWAV